MNGRFYGGGMMTAPQQDRNNPEGKLSVVVMHGSGKLKTLMVFPSIFKGEHISHTEMVEVLTGKEITVITFFYAKWNVDIDFHGRICDIPSLHCNLLLL